MRKMSTQMRIGNLVSYISRCFLLLVCCLPAGEIFAQNIFFGEPVQWVGRPNSYSTTPYNTDYRTTSYRRVSVNGVGVFPNDGRGQWSTTINVQNTGGNIGPDNMPGGGGAGWLLISGPASNRFQNKWNFNGIGQAGLNAINDITLQGGGQDMGLNMSTTGYYTFNMRDNGYSSSQVFIGYTSAVPVTVSRTGQAFNPSGFTSDISITTSAAPSSGENVYVRYVVGTNDFSSGTAVVQATGSGTSWTAAIPQQTCGVTVYYYVFTSTRSISQLQADSERNRSLAAIRYDDNGGANYSYTVSPVPTATITNNSGTTLLNCITTSISVTASGGVAYSWTGGLGNSASASITAPGTYTVTATAANGCTDDESIVITQDITPPTAGITNNSGTTVLTCTQTSIEVTATGGVSYEWDNELGTDPSVEITAPGTYTVTVTGANGCINTASITVTQDVTTPTAGITNNTGTTVLTCTVTSISVTATGGGSYAWDGGLGTSASASITAPGTYTVTVTGANGCTDQESIVITQDITAPTAGITNNTGATELTCTVTSISVTATGGGSYAWDGGLGNSASANITAPGTYTVTVTGANGCTDQESIVITQDITTPTAGITNNTGATELTCTITSISVTATGGGSYAWDGGLGNSASASITAPGTYTVTVTGANGCTDQESIVITQDITTPTAGITNNTGTTVLTCAVTSISVTATGGGSYAWDGGLGNSASASITAPGTYTVTVTGANGCTDQESIVITQNINVPGTPAPVQGISNVCQYVGTPTQLTYSVPQDPNAISYSWTVPPTVTIVSGQGTNSINVTIDNGFIANANKLVRVRASSTCGTSGERLFYLLAQLPTTPAPIVASSTDICAVIGTPGTITYTIPKVAAATSYIWTAQSGTTTILHPNGTGVNDTTVTVSFSNSFTTSAITVAAVNDCGTSGIRSFTIVKNTPSTPGLISGPTNACAFIAPGGTAASYSVSPVAGATSYTWTVPVGAIGLTGQGTNSISFIYPSGFTSGTISVVANNGCGNSGIRTLSITRLNPATPGGIDVIQLQSCPERVYSYTIASIPANATSIQWTASAGTILTGQGTNSITVSYPGTVINGTVSATAVSNCGNSLARTINVKLPACVLNGREAGNTTAKGNATVSQESMAVNIFPNPTSSDFKLQVIATGSESAKVRVMDLQGRTLSQFTVKPYQTINLGSALKAGSYMVEVRQGNQVKSTRVIKL